MIKIDLDRENSTQQLKELCAGDRVLLSGTVLTARDAAHKEINMLYNNGEKLPYDMTDATIYYAGPTDTPPGRAVGSIGPTTSVRMDSYAELMKKIGVRALIGKGERTDAAREIFLRDGIVYFIATGGCGALLSAAVESCEVVAFPELGCESIKKLTVKDFPVTVAYDLKGGDVFKINR